MNYNYFLTLFLFLICVDAAWAYGSSSSKKACEKPKFSHFSPPDKSTTASRSEFTFNASANTQPDSIKVEIKEIPVKIQVSQNNPGYHVKGSLPESLVNTYARIAINAETVKGCKGSDGWLVNIVD